MNHPKHFPLEIIIFTRYPQAGKTKTRLIPELGADGAAQLQRSLTEHSVRTAAQLIKNSTQSVDLSIYYHGGSHAQMKQWLGPELRYHEQNGNDLGQKMLKAFHETRDRGAKQTVLFGSDCPSLDEQLVNEAFDKLRNTPLVLGPAVDGGYYLVGTSDNLSDKVLDLLFSDINWGTSDVFEQTMDRARSAGLKPFILKELHDIDHPKDLTHFHHHPNP